MKKKSNEKPTYDKDGNWVEERGRIKGAIRRTFRLHPAMKEVLQEARVELPPKTLKDGSAGKKNQIRYRCAGCGELFSQKNVQVDHKETVIPLDKSEAEMPFEEWIALTARGIFCKKENLQVLCSTKKKTSRPESKAATAPKPLAKILFETSLSATNPIKHLLFTKT